MSALLRLAGIAAAFVVQAALVIWLIVPRAALLANGTEIRLPVIPVDPHDLFRGDYVALAFPISTLRSDQLAGDDDFDPGERVFVSLIKEGDVWRAAAMTHAAPTAGAVFLGGTVDASDTRANGCQKPCRAYTVSYGLEQFFVPEGAGKALEQLRNDQHVSVDVAVGPTGEALLKRLRVDGETRYEEPLF